jgi:ketosteroid isomerase-like protein
VAEERTEVVRQFMDAITRGDIPALLAVSDPEVELVPLVSVWPTPYRGHDGLRQWHRDLAENWEVFEVRPEGFKELPGGAMLVDIQWRSQGKGGGPEVAGPAAVIYRFRDGRVLSAHVHVDASQALRDPTAG